MNLSLSVRGVVHSFFAIGAGFLTTAVLVVIATIIAARIWPQRHEHGPTPRGYRLFNLLGTAVFTIAGGFVTAVVASDSPLVHSLMLAFVLLLLSGISAVQTGKDQPLGYQLALTAVAPLGAVAGALLRLHFLGYV